jgi:hypothetical protein
MKGHILQMPPDHELYALPKCPPEFEKEVVGGIKHEYSILN